MLIRRTSSITGIDHEREIGCDPEDFARYQLGESLEDAMPYLSDGDRTYILTGATEGEWAAAFARNRTN